MAKVSCKGCAYYSKMPALSPIHGTWCGHPDAKKFDRELGEYSPAITSPTGFKNISVTADCDRENRYRPYRPWWRFW